MRRFILSILLLAAIYGVGWLSQDHSNANGITEVASNIKIDSDSISTDTCFVADSCCNKSI